MTAPVYACARCGERERAGDTFLCRKCLASSTRLREQGIAEATFPGDHKAQRALLTQSWHWQGWNRRMKGERDA